MCRDIPAAMMTIRSMTADRFFFEGTIGFFSGESFWKLKKRMSEQVGGRSSERSLTIYMYKSYA